MAKRKATPAAATTEKEQPEVTVTDESDVEMKEEVADEKETTDRIPLFIPSLNEFRKDLGLSYDNRTLMIGPVKFTDLNRGKLSIVVQKADYCQVKLAKQDNGVLQGYLELMYNSESLALSCLSELDSYKNSGVIVKHMIHVDNKVIDDEDVKASIGLNGKIENSDASAEKVVVLSQLSPSITIEDIKEKIPEAKTVLFPVSHITNERKSYAFVEVPQYKNVKYHDGWSVTFGEQKSKCHKLERIPKVINVLKDLRKFKGRLDKKEQLDSLAKAELKALNNYGIHYQRSEWVDEEKKESLKTLSGDISKGMRGQRNQNSQSGYSGNNSGNMGINFNNLALLSALSALKKPKMVRNQRW